MQFEDHRPKVAAQRRERMRARLVQSALTLVASNGIAATSIDEIISHAEVSRGTFYKYFTAPADLIDTTAKLVTNELLRVVDPLVLQHDAPDERVATGMRLSLAIATQHPVVGAFVSRLGWPNMPTDQLALVFLPRDLRLGMQQGCFNKMEMSAALNLTIGMVMGSIHAMLSGKTPTDYAETVTQMVLQGLGVDAQRARHCARVKLKLPDLSESSLLADL